MTNYQQAKQALKDVSIEAKQEYKNDKPAVRMIINDEANCLNASYDLSKYQCDLLANYACTLHPKN